MRQRSTRILTASLLGLAFAGCRNQPDIPIGSPDMAMSTDMTMPRYDLAGENPADLSVSTDLSPSGDLAVVPDLLPPADLTVIPPDLTSTPPDLSGADLMPPPAPTTFLVVRVGDGSAALSNAATAAFLERRQLSDGSLVGTAQALPTATSGTNHRLTVGGNVTSEGGLSLSADGRYLLIGGYDAATGTASVAGTASSSVNRVIGRIDGAGNIDTSTAADFFSAQNIRSVSSPDGTNLWAAGSGGIAYTTFGSTSKPTALLSANIRWISILEGQLLATSGSGSFHGVNQLGVGTPTTPMTPTLLPGFSAQPSASPYGFVAFDRDSTWGIDVIYVADDRSLASGGGVQRWSLSGTQWNLDGTFAKGLTAGARGLAGYVNGSSVVLLATTAEAPPRVVTFVDDGSAIAMISATALATAATNTAYRGIALPPQ